MHPGALPAGAALSAPISLARRNTVLKRAVTCLGTVPWQVLQDLAAGQHEVIVELPMRQIEGSVRFHVVRPERAEHGT